MDDSTEKGGVQNPLEKTGRILKSLMSRNKNQHKMITVILSHEVKNYSTWRKVYDEDEINRTRAGLIMTGVYQSIENPNMITLIGESPNVEAFQNFISNPDLKVAMEQGGVIGIPEVRIMREV